MTPAAGAVNIIHAMESDEDYPFNVNVVNGGLIENLPAEAGVEVPAVFNRAGIHPEAVGRLPSQLAALNTTNLNVQQVLAHAVLEKSKDLAMQAVMLDPLAASVMKLADIRNMMGELFEAEAQWLPDWLLSRRMKLVDCLTGGLTSPGPPSAQPRAEAMVASRAAIRACSRRNAALPSPSSTSRVTPRWKPGMLPL